MGQSKHTPGPWTIDGSVRTSINAGTKHIALANFYNSVEPEFNVSGEEHEANARLIAAAPELLAALDELVDALTAGYVPQQDGRMLKEARALIAKAEGTPTPNSTTLLSAVSAKGDNHGT